MHHHYRKLKRTMKNSSMPTTAQKIPSGSLAEHAIDDFQ
ncbi:hypothetical protein J813_3430 [Acinetobacter sp. 25977_10]|nr:hypothetical protein J813_3430 [Acinetobacter sp. 25977_10]KCX91961.1 hypothetical protein J568_2942 [Acinetobacter baumannii 6112]